MQQQHMIQQQRQQQAARQAMLAQQYSGQLPIGMQNGMNQMAQFNAMRGPMARPVNLPQHLQQQQQQAEHTLQQQQAQAQAQQHQVWNSIKIIDVLRLLPPKWTLANTSSINNSS